MDEKDPNSLRRHVDAMHADGTHMSPPFDKAVGELEEIPADGMQAEMPYSIARRVGLTARSSTWPRGRKLAET